jgi:hypothetical protein
VLTSFNTTIGQLVPTLPPMLLFEFRRVAHLDRPWNPMGKGSTDLFPRAAIPFPHLEDRRILFRRPSNALYLRPHCCGMYLGVEVFLSERMPNASERIGRWRCSGICSN